MRTARTLTVSPIMVCSGGVPGPGGLPGPGDVPGPGGVPGPGVYLVWGCTWSKGVVPGQVLPHPCEQNDRQARVKT